MAAAPTSPVPPAQPPSAAVPKPASLRKVLADCPLALLPTEVIQGVSQSSVSALKRTETAGKVIGTLTVALVAALYYVTLYPSLPGGDSGELIVASCSLGLPHPPGYPLFAMIGWLFTHIPFGSIAWRVNLFSAVCGVIASAFLYLAIFRVCLHTHYACARLDADSETDAKLAKPKEQQVKADEAHSSISCGFSSPVPWAACFATLMFALSPLVWFYSVQAEVFAVNNMFVGVRFPAPNITTESPFEINCLCVQVLVAGAVLFWERRSDAIAMMGAFAVGLGFTNQHTLVFYAFPLCAWALYNKPSLLAPATFVKLCFLGLLGLTPYIYLPIVSINGAPLGGWGDQSDFAGFKKHFLREEYGTFRLFSGNEQKGDQLALALKMYFFNYSTQSLHLGWPLAIAGVFFIASCSKRANGGQFKGWNLLSLLLFMYAHACLTKQTRRSRANRYVFYMVVFHILSNLPIEQALFFGVHIRFWMQPNAITAIFVGAGTL